MYLTFQGQSSLVARLGGELLEIHTAWLTNPLVCRLCTVRKVALEVLFPENVYTFIILTVVNTDIIWLTLAQRKQNVWEHGSWTGCTKGCRQIAQSRVKSLVRVGTASESSVSILAKRISNTIKFKDELRRFWWDILMFKVSVFLWRHAVFAFPLWNPSFHCWNIVSDMVSRIGKAHCFSKSKNRQMHKQNRL